MKIYKFYNTLVQVMKSKFEIIINHFTNYFSGKNNRTY